MLNRSAWILFLLSANAHAFNMAYVEVNANRFENAGCYIQSDNQRPFFAAASIFAANVAGDSPNAPEIFLNEQVQQILQSTQVKNLQKKGMKVLLSVLGNHQNAGWSCVTDPAAAKRFAGDIVQLVKKYNLDGIDIDDEYSRCLPNNYSMIMIAEAIKADPEFKGKLLTKALYHDVGYFAASYNGHKLSEYLDYGWEMSYSYSDLMGRIKPYLQNGMPIERLMIGGVSGNPYPDPYEIGKFTTQHQLAGLMVYDVTMNSEAYLSQLQMGANGSHEKVEVIPDCLG